MFFKLLIFNVCVIKRKFLTIFFASFSSQELICITYKMFNLGDIINECNKEHNEKWPYIPDSPYRILIMEVLDQEKQMHYWIW